MVGKEPERSFRPELVPGFVAVHNESLPENAEAQARRNFPDLVTPLLEDCTSLQASDIHIEPHHNGARLRVRLDGVVCDVAHLSIATGKTLVNQLKAMAGLDPIARFTPQESHATVPLGGNKRIDLRIALAPSMDRETVAIRLLDPRRLDRSISALGLGSRNHRILSEWIEDVSGMFLGTGPTGSGKTTTLYSLLRRLKDANRVVLSLEDPVEYQIDGISQIEVDELHGLNFAEGIKSLLRHDPDYMMLGEIRDSISAHTAVNAAISGRVLLSTMHSRDCVGAITALRNWELTDHEIAESVSVVMAQRLVRKVCTECGERRKASESETRWLQQYGFEPPAHLWEGRGCNACRNLGYRGRTGVFELWRLHESDYQMVLRHTDEHRLRMHLLDRGHSTLVNEAYAKMEEGITSFAELRQVAAGSFPGGEVFGESEESSSTPARGTYLGV